MRYSLAGKEGKLQHGKGDKPSGRLPIPSEVGRKISLRKKKKKKV